MALGIVRNVKKVSRLKFLVKTCPLCLLWLIKIDILNIFVTLKWRIVLERLSIPFRMFAQCKNAKSHGKKHSALLNTPEMKKKKRRPNLNCFQLHTVTTQTETHFECYWVMCAHTHEHRAITRRTCQMNHQVTRLPMVQARNVSASPGTGKQPILTLQSSPWAN